MAPLGGERLYTGSSYVIRWTATDNVGVTSIDVAFSSDGGTTYAAVAGCSGLSGTAQSCTWAAPGPATTQGRIRVTARDAAGQAGTATSGANFTVVSGTPSVTLTVTPPTNGTISGTGIACGTGGNDCSEAYDYGTVVPLTATPDSGYTFGGWTGACTGTGACTVTMTAARSVAASFTPTSVSYTLTVTKAGTGSGAVTSSPAGISCGADCSESYSSGTVVTLSAAAATGSGFSGWTGACSGTGACSVTMTAARTVGATFTIADTTAPTVAVTAPATGSTVSGTVTVSATASDDVAVAGVQFLLDGALLGAEDTTSPYSVAWNTTTATAGSHTLTARARDAAGNQATSAAVPVTVASVVSTAGRRLPHEGSATTAAGLTAAPAAP